MHRNQQNNRILETFTVKPGPETGLYYILVANLAHRTTWRDLKAFASQACEVDHAEVYPPTSGFVRVKGRANFEKAFKYLDGNTLEYRALQADARNMHQATVVKLLPTDYHATKIMRGDNGRVVSEPEDPVTDSNESSSQGVGAAMGSPYLGYNGNASPTFNMGDAQWGYVTSPSYGAGGGYQPAPTAPPTPPGSLGYHQVAISNHRFIPQLTTGPPPTSHQTMANPTPVFAASGVTQYQYSDPAGYYPQGTAYGARGPGYAGFVQPAATNGGHAYATGNGWLSEATPSPQPDQIPGYDYARPAVVLEQRKIIIRDLEREGLSEAVVTNLLVQHAGIGVAPGQVEKLELPFNKDGKARGTAYVTFGTTALANAAVAALDGRKMGTRRLSARLVVEGVSPDGFDSSRSGRRQVGGGGGGGGKSAGRGSNSRVDAGKPPRSTQSQSQPQSPFQSSQPAEGLPQPSYLATSVSVPTFPSTTGSGWTKTKEERPVIVDGSGGRFKKEAAPVVVDGTAGKKGDGGHRGSRR
ncbi:uncharacterized protein B0H64DRAFT_152274 [Chaetomium fimeti]|uniref:RRM domain-containing protein n=1 Tax=Chaetomium fimeti TaxID=1854472 RepID=A0AAE0HFT3_9PEZI|nr:hypothetical protein B0H64DRAFT_152274 [Chaetomium fimeti]